jgi:hypothetical protein
MEEALYKGNSHANGGIKVLVDGVKPIEVEGNGKTKGSLKSKQQGADKSNSINKATKILNTLESTEAKATKIINEDLQKMKNLISYNRKTQ